MLLLLDNLRTHIPIGRVLTFGGYFFLAIWNHILSKVPSYGFRYFVAKYVYGMRIGKSHIHYGVTLLSPWRIRVGDNCNIQMGSFLDGRGGLVIGDNVDITMGVRILTEQHDIDSPQYSVVKRRVWIHDNAVIGSFATILPGVVINEGGVVGAGSVVAKEVPAYSLVVGNPAAFKRHRSRDIDYRLNFRRPFH